MGDMVNLHGGMILYFWVFIGAGLGGVIRFALSGFAEQHLGGGFPWGTLAVNVTGSFVIGFFAAVTAPEGKFFASATARQFVMAGVLGGYTTYSAFSLQTLQLARNGQWLCAAANTGGTVVLCFAAVWLGHICALALGGPRA